MLANRFGVETAQAARASAAALGSVDSPQALVDYQAAKRAHKAADESRPIELRTLTDGGQPAEETAHALADFVSAAQHTLDIAIYDLRLPGPAGGDRPRRAHRRSEARRRRAARLQPRPRRPVPVPPPPRTNPALIESLPFPTAPIPGVPDLMHHKYVVRDAEAVWTGSTNWTADSWTREENVIVTVDVARARGALPRRLRAALDDGATSAAAAGSTRPRSPSTGRPSAPGSARNAAKSSPTGSRRRSARAKRRVRIASPVISSGPILGTLAEVAADGKVDLAGVVDRTQVHEVLRQWHAERQRRLEGAAAPGRAHAGSASPASTRRPMRPDRVHDYMHAKVTVADDIVFVGSFNLSHSGEHERRERARDRGSGARRAARRRSSTGSGCDIPESTYRRALQKVRCGRVGPTMLKEQWFPRFQSLGHPFG